PENEEPRRGRDVEKGNSGKIGPLTRDDSKTPEKEGGGSRNHRQNKGEARIGLKRDYGEKSRAETFQE
ncbi:hypothetical protein AKJ53_01160, partial [candidate division MSBL1 archaeon SCGC-AAA382F02]